MLQTGSSDSDDGRRGDRPAQADHASSRRRFLAGAAGTVALPTMPGPVAGASRQDDVVSVVAVEGEGHLYRDLVEEYVQEDTGLAVEVTLFPFADLFDRISSVLGSQGTAYDLVLMDDPWFPQFATDLDPLEQWLPEGLPADQLIDTTVDIATWPTPGRPTVPAAEGTEQRIRGQVIVGNTQLFVYNREYFERVGEDAPETWEDVYRAGQAIDDEIEGANGYVIRGQPGNPINANFFSLGTSRIGDMFTEDWRYDWNDEDGHETLRFYVEDLRSISPAGVDSFGSDQVLTRIAAGSAAQAPMWPAAAATLLDADDAAEAENLAFVPVPAGFRRAPTQGNWILGINSHVSDQRKENAGRVVQSSISEQAQDVFVDLGGVPFRHDTFENNGDAHPWFEPLYESLQIAVPRPRTPLWPEMQIIQGQYLNSALTGSMSPQQALETTELELEAMLENAGYYD